MKTQHNTLSIAVRTRTCRLALALSVLFITACGKGAPPPQEAKVATAGAATDSHAAAGNGHAQAGGKEHDEGGLIKLSPEEISVSGIKVEALSEQEVSEQLTLTATIRPNQERITHISPRVPGRVVKVGANLGDFVKAGQSLAVLDSLEVGEAHSAYLQAATHLALAKAEFERAEVLHGDQVISQKDHQRAHAEYEKAKASFTASGDKLRMLGVSPPTVADGKAVSVFPLSTPFAGTVIEKHAILGELAQPDKQLFVVADLSTLWIEANLFEKDLARVRPGAPAEVTVEAYPGEVFRGKLTYIAAVVDKESRTVSARVEVANTGGRLKPEMFATAAVRTSRPAAKGKALLLPEDAVMLMQGQPTAFVEEAGGFEPRPVELGEKLHGRVVIKNGVKPGERVVVVGAYALKARLLKSQIGDAH